MATPSVKVPLHRLTKKEIIYLATHRCEAHGHTFLSHYGCYQPAAEHERIGFLDIEASNLDADFGIILSYSIKDADSNEILCDTLTSDDIEAYEPGQEDKRLVKQLIADIGKFDKLVTYYGTRFDIPFIRTRALVTHVPFPCYGTMTHKDLYYVLRYKFKLSSNRLENGCRVLLGKTQKTRIENKYWLGAMRGDPKSLSYVLDHNKKDVLDLEKLYNKTIIFARQQNVSI